MSRQFNTHYAQLNGVPTHRGRITKNGAMIFKQYDSFGMGSGSFTVPFLGALLHPILWKGLRKLGD